MYSLDKQFEFKINTGDKTVEIATIFILIYVVHRKTKTV